MTEFKQEMAGRISDLMDNKPAERHGYGISASHDQAPIFV